MTVTKAIKSKSVIDNNKTEVWKDMQEDMADDLGLYEPLSTDETVLLADKGQHSTFSDSQELSKQENEDGSYSILYHNF